MSFLLSDLLSAIRHYEAPELSLADTIEKVVFGLPEQDIRTVALQLAEEGVQFDVFRDGRPHQILWVTMPTYVLSRHIINHAHDLLKDDPQLVVADQSGAAIDATMHMRAMHAAGDPMPSLSDDGKSYWMYEPSSGMTYNPMTGEISDL